MMWHEARRQERRLKGMMVDYSQRAERRKAYYDKIKMEPKQFIRIFGNSMKINIDQTIYENAESTMVPWQNDNNLIIDRFDVRAHLDVIPESAEERNETSSLSPKTIEEETKCCFERYRVLVQNEFAGVSEENCLKQIYIDEQFGNTSKPKKEEKKKLADKKAAIAFVYDNSAPVIQPMKEEEEEKEFDSDNEMDIDLEIDVEKLSNEQIEELNKHAMKYGLSKNDYYQSLLRDKKEADDLRLAKIVEDEKAQFSGRKARKERRIYKEKRIKERGNLSPPSYALKLSPKKEKKEKESSSSRSTSPGEERITYITSFGGNSSDEGKVVHGPSLPKHLAQDHRKRLKRSSSRNNKSKRKRSRSSSESNSKQRHRRRYSSTSTDSSNSSIKKKSKSPGPSSTQFEKPIKRYRRKSLEESENTSSDSSSDGKSHNISYTTMQSIAMAGSRISNKKLSQRELLEKRMQAQLTKHYKADKRAERKKTEREIQERIDREDELRELSLMLRKRDRDRRHREREERHLSDSNSNSRSRSRSRKRTRSRSSRKYRSRSRSKLKYKSRSRSRSPIHRRYRSSNSKSPRRKSRSSSQCFRRGRLVDY